MISLRPFCQGEEGGDDANDGEDTDNDKEVTEEPTEFITIEPSEEATTESPVSANGAVVEIPIAIPQFFNS